MGLHNLHGLGTQLSGILQYFKGNGDFTHIVKQRAIINSLLVLGGIVQKAGNFNADSHSGYRMGNRVLTSEVDGIRQHLQIKVDIRW